MKKKFFGKVTEEGQLPYLLYGKLGIAPVTAAMWGHRWLLWEMFGEG